MNLSELTEIALNFPADQQAEAGEVEPISAEVLRTPAQEKVDSLGDSFKITA